MVSVIPNARVRSTAAEKMNRRDAPATEASPHRWFGRAHPWWLLVGMVVLVAALGFSWLTGAPAWWEGARATLASPARFRAWTQGIGLWAPVVFVLAEIAQVIVAFIPGGIFPPVAAAAFGPIAGLALCMSGTTIGSAIVFMLARKWGRPLLERLVKPETIDTYAGIIVGRGGLWLFVVMVLPFLPNDAICALVGASAISFRRFLIVTALGRLPSTVVGVYLTASLLTTPSAIVLPAVLLVVIGFGLGFRYRDRLEGWLVRQSAVDKARYR